MSDVLNLYLNSSTNMKTVEIGITIFFNNCTQYVLRARCVVQIPLGGLGASCFTAFKCRPVVTTSIVSKFIGNGAGPLAVNGRLHVWADLF